MNNEIVEVGKKGVTIFQAIVTMIPIFFILVGVGFSYASGVGQNTSDVIEIKSDVKELQDVKVDINTLNVQTATLQNEVEHIKDSQQRTETQINETNSLLRELLRKQEVKPEPKFERPPAMYRRYNQW